MVIQGRGGLLGSVEGCGGVLMGMNGWEVRWCCAETVRILEVCWAVLGILNGSGGKSSRGVEGFSGLTQVME